MRRVGNMPPEEIFSRSLCGIVLCVSSFFSWGHWAAFILGVLFLVSAGSGFCLTCYLYKKFIKKGS